MFPRRKSVVGPSIVRFAVPVALVAALAHSLAFAQPPTPQPVDQPPEFATVRAKYENMTREQYTATGYQPVGECVSSPLGGMGVHAFNQQLFDAQFKSGQLDPQTPPILLIGGDGQVVGLEWEAASSVQPAPVLFGQTVEILPGHPGLEEPHYMIHAYFRQNGQVLFASFDPQLRCPAATGGGPGTLPGTGSDPWERLIPFSLLSIALIGLGVMLHVIRRRALSSPPSSSR